MRARAKSAVIDSGREGIQRYDHRKKVTGMRYLVNRLYKVAVYQEIEADSPGQAQELGNRLHRALVADAFDGLAQAPPTGVSGAFDHQDGPNPEPVP